MPGKVANQKQRSKEKNVIMEETRRRNEASMARKRLNNAKGIINTAVATAGTSSDGAMAPSSTGAMDSLLEKLRAAAPQARDQRDRRRRARLKDRHQIRVASGQTIPDLGDLTKGVEDQEGEKKVLSLERAVSGDDGERAGDMAAISEGEDVAERAASMLQGLRGDGDTDTRPGSRDGSLRVRRRRESADDEKRMRRRRRGLGSSSNGGGSSEDSPMSPTVHQGSNSIPEEASSVTTPTTIVCPPSPEGPEKKRVDITL